MDANIWQVISIIGFSLSGIVFVITVFIYLKFNILSVVGDLSGRTATKQIRAIREQNISTGDKPHRPNAFNINRGALTESVVKGSRIGNSKEILKINKSKELAIVHNENPNKITEKFSDVTNLYEKSTELLSESTELLRESTEVLENEEFQIEKNIVSIHTNESI